MPKSVRPKFEIQEDRIARELDDALSKPHPETVRSPELGSSVKTAQIADVAPSEVVERTLQREQDATSDPRREADASKEPRGQSPGPNDDAENRLGHSQEEEDDGIQDWVR